VALILMALVTSLASGPAMQWLLYQAEPDEDVVTLLRRGAFVSELHAHTPGDAIAELVRALGSLLTGIKRRARDAVVERELVAATGLGDEVAIPHAAVEGLDRPLLAFGRAPHGIDFDAPDGRPARFVFCFSFPRRPTTRRSASSRPSREPRLPNRLANSSASRRVSRKCHGSSWPRARERLGYPAPQPQRTQTKIEGQRPRETLGTPASPSAR
jgi:mannitol/fructose-specific phosphotransferase system IIA component (Ntr-type)